MSAHASSLLGRACARHEQSEQARGAVPTLACAKRVVENMTRTDLERNPPRRAQWAKTHQTGREPALKSTTTCSESRKAGIRGVDQFPRSVPQRTRHAYTKACTEN